MVSTQEGSQEIRAAGFMGIWSRNGQRENTWCLTYVERKTMHGSCLQPLLCPAHDETFGIIYFVRFIRLCFRGVFTPLGINVADCCSGSLRGREWLACFFFRGLGSRNGLAFYSRYDCCRDRFSPS